MIMARLRLNFPPVRRYHAAAAVLLAALGSDRPLPTTHRLVVRLRVGWVVVRRVTDRLGRWVWSFVYKNRNPRWRPKKPTTLPYRGNVKRLRYNKIQKLLKRRQTRADGRRRFVLKVRGRSYPVRGLFHAQQVAQALADQGYVMTKARIQTEAGRHIAFIRTEPAKP